MEIMWPARHGIKQALAVLRHGNYLSLPVRAAQGRIEIGPWDEFCGPGSSAPEPDYPQTLAIYGRGHDQKSLEAEIVARFNLCENYAQ